MTFAEYGRNCVLADMADIQDMCMPTLTRPQDAGGRCMAVTNGHASAVPLKAFLVERSA